MKPSVILTNLAIVLGIDTSYPEWHQTNPPRENVEARIYYEVTWHPEKTKMLIFDKHT